MFRDIRNNRKQEDNVIEYPAIVDINVELLQNSVNFQDQEPKTVKKKKKQNGTENKADNADDNQNDAAGGDE